MKMMMVGIMLALCAVCCNPKVTQTCVPQVSRCIDNRAELCDANKQWKVVMDCSEIGSEWQCGEKDNEHTCIRQGGN